MEGNLEINRGCGTISQRISIQHYLDILGNCREIMEKLNVSKYDQIWFERQELHKGEQHWIHLDITTSVKNYVACFKREAPVL